MRKQFDIKYRPQIESGEYKVETGDGRSVRIISWDKKVFGGNTEIVALVSTPEGNTETVQLYCPDGKLIASSWNEKFKLFIVIPEPELTEFEKAVGSELFVPPFNEKQIKVIREESAKLLALARKELEPEIKTEALKDLPRWKKFAPNINDPLSEQQICEELKNSVMRVDDGGYCWIISREELNKLPKEDEGCE